VEENPEAKLASCSTQPSESQYGVYLSMAEDIPSSKSFLLDCGATHEMWDKTIPINITSSDQVTISLASKGGFTQADERGNADVQVTSPVGHVTNLHFEEVLRVPEIRSNLISVHSLVEQGLAVLFTTEGAAIAKAGSVEIKNPNESVVAMAPHVGRYFMLEGNPEVHRVGFDEAVMAKVHAASTGKSVVTFEMLHKRMGHASISKLKELIKKDSVKTPQVIKIDNFFCDVCARAKAKALPFFPVNTPLGHRVLAQLYFDVAGPIKLTSIGGANFFATIVDGYSRRYFTFPLKDRKSICDVVEGFLVKEIGKLASKILE
jgi:hypothetical protein